MEFARGEKDALLDASTFARGPIIYGTLMAMISSSPSVFAFMEQLMGTQDV